LPPQLIGLPQKYSCIIDRNILQEKLREFLINSKRIIVSGSSGLGKTSLILLYAHQSSNYQKIIWFEARTNITEEYRKKLSELSSDSNTGMALSEEVLINQLSDEVNQLPSCLIVFNNVILKNRKSILSFCNKIDPKFHIIFTQNTEEGLMGFSVFSMPTCYEDGEVDEFLKISNTIVSSQEKEQLITVTGGHPLFLYAAINVIHRESKTVQDFFDNRKWFEENACRGHDQLSLNNLFQDQWEGLDHNQKDFLSFCAYVDTEELNSSLIKEIFNNLNINIKDNNLSFFLVKISNECYMLHTIWAEFIRNRIEGNFHYKKYKVQSIEQLASYMSNKRLDFAISKSKNDRENYIKSYKHALRFYHHLKFTNDSSSTAHAELTLLKEIIWYQLNINCDVNESHNLLVGHKTFLMCFDWLFYYQQQGVLKEKTNDFSAASDFFIEIISRLEKDMPDNTMDFFKAKWHYFNTAFSRRVSLSSSEIERYKSLLEKKFDQEKNNKLAAYYLLKYNLLLANFYQKNGPESYKEAVKYYKLAIDIGSQNQLPVIMTCVGLASILRDSGKYREALLYVKKSHEEAKSYYGEEHSIMADIYNEYGNISLSLSANSFTKALNLYGKSSTIYKKYNMQEKYAKSLTNIGFTHYALGNIEKSERYLQESIQEYLTISHDNDSCYRLIYTYLDYSKVKLYNDQLDESIYYRVQAYDLAVKKFGEDEIAAKMAHFFIPPIPWKSTIKVDSALKSYEEIYEYTEKLYGKQHPETFENRFYYLIKRMEDRADGNKIDTLNKLLSLISDIQCFNQKQEDAIINDNLKLVELFTLNELDSFRIRFFEKFPEQFFRVLKLYNKYGKIWQETEANVSHGIIIRDQVISEVNFSSYELFGYQFMNCTFSLSTFINADLRKCVFENCAFLNCDFTSVNFEMANMRTSSIDEHCKITDAKFNKLKLDKANLRTFINLAKRDAEGNLKGIDLEGQDCSNIDLSGLWLNEANFKEANLAGCRFNDSNLDAANFLSSKSLATAAVEFAYSPSQSAKGLPVKIPMMRQGQGLVTSYFSPKSSVN